MIHISHFGETRLIGIFSNLPNTGLIPSFIIPSNHQCHKMWAEQRREKEQYPRIRYIYHFIHLSADLIKYKSDKILLT